MEKIDWSKPIEWCSGGPTKVEARFVAFDGEFAIVERCKSYVPYTLDGKPVGSAQQRIFNVPPPKRTETLTMALIKYGGDKILCGCYRKNGQHLLDSLQSQGRIVALKEVTITEGEGIA